MSEYNALAFAGCSAGIEYVTNIFIACLCPAFFHFRLAWQFFAKLQEVFKEDGMWVVITYAFDRIEDVNALQRRAKWEYAVCFVILFLFAYKDVTNVGVLYHVLYLLFGT